MATWQTALVTGASSGIGREFARQLAADGTDIVIVARRAERLESLATEVRTDHGVDVEILAADLLDPEDRAGVERRLVDVSPPVDLLVNNAGMSTFGPFTDLDPEREARLVELNALTVLRLTHAAVPGMVERGRGTIINVSSMAGFQPLPMNTTYAATKAFVTSFSEGLHEELRGTGVHVTALCPGFVHTEFHEGGEIEDAGIPEMAFMDADEVARAGLRGAAKGEALVIPGLGYRTLATASRFTPRRVVRRLVGEAMRRS